MDNERRAYLQRLRARMRDVIEQLEAPAPGLTADEVKLRASALEQFRTALREVETALTGVPMNAPSLGAPSPTADALNGALRDVSNAPMASEGSANGDAASPDPTAEPRRRPSKDDAGDA